MERKVAVVTGGGSGIGYAISQKFVKQGFKTIIVGRNKEKLENTCKTIGGDIHAEVFDLNNLAAIPAFVRKLVENYDRINILVNNAGVNLKKDILEVTDEEFEKIQLTNQKSVFSLSREVSKQMVEKGQGVILNISSMASRYGLPKVIAYTASKSAIEGMTRAMAVELSPLGIRVNCIAPGFIESEMSLKALNNDPERKSKVLGRTPLGRLGQPGDIANAAYFLCSDEASFITGVVLPVDGGNSIGF
jgi:NAD(P)-dependent dehydrogenase (short-subunit alcohol dehydrogenase family)